MYDICELCRHCPGYNPPPEPGAIGNYTVIGADLPDCSICDDNCDNRDITVFTKNKGYKDSHVDAMEIANVVSLKSVLENHVVNSSITIVTFLKVNNLWLVNVNRVRCKHGYTGRI